MNNKLCKPPFFKKMCTVCLVTVGLTYFAVRTTNIHKYLKFFVKRMLSNRDKVSVVSTCLGVDTAVQNIKRDLSKEKILGLDCEWVSVGKNRHPVALLQLAAPDGFCALFRLSSIKNIPSSLQDLLEDKGIVKVGIAIASDARYLMADYGVRCESYLDLRYLAAEAGFEPRGLANLAKDLFGIQLDKDWRVRCSDWEAEPLTPIQIKYAVEDARIAVRIFEYLNHKMICNHHSFWQRLFWNEVEYWSHSYKLWSQFIGLNYHVKSGNRVETSGIGKPRPIMKVTKRNYNTLLQKPHYSNIYLLAPDDQVLCTISENKAAWYLNKELVDTICDDPKTLRLRFEPSRRSAEQNGYYTKPKDNKCVVCGCESDLRRKNVVPVEYRTHFEDSLKNHHSHDVLLMCLRCHIQSNHHDQTLRDVLVIECSAPTAGGKNSKIKEDQDLKAVRSAARALLYNGEKIPDERKKYLQSVIVKKLSLDLLNTEVLEDIVDIDIYAESEDYVPHGLKVVRHFGTECKSHKDGVEELERRWRQHFIDTMKPSHLPQLWSVHYTRD